MNLVKSAGIGLLFVCGFAIASPFIFLAVAFFLPTPKNGGSWGWDPIAFMKSPLAWAILFVTFAAGFVWEYRRL
jgi:hypothetical protein